MKQTEVKSLRQIIKAFADDNRLRIINVLAKEELTVSQICEALRLNQPSVSKHLGRLRLLRIVGDRRQGNLVYYSLNTNQKTLPGMMASFIVSRFSQLKTFQEDRGWLKKNKR